MEKEFVPYELTVKLKELGFDEECFGYYFVCDGLPEGYAFCYFNKPEKFEAEESVYAPQFSQVFRWFREKYQWQHSINATADQHSHQLGYNFWIWNYKTGEEYDTMPTDRPSGDWAYETYEEAESDCLEKLIELVKQQDK